MDIPTILCTLSPMRMDKDRTSVLRKSPRSATFQSRTGRCESRLQILRRMSSSTCTVKSANASLFLMAASAWCFASAINWSSSPLVLNVVAVIIAARQMI